TWSDEGRWFRVRIEAERPGVEPRDHSAAVRDRSVDRPLHGGQIGIGRIRVVVRGGRGAKLVPKRVVAIGGRGEVARCADCAAGFVPVVVHIRAEREKSPIFERFQRQAVFPSARRGYLTFAARSSVTSKLSCSA